MVLVLIVECVVGEFVDGGELVVEVVIDFGCVSVY